MDAVGMNKQTSANDHVKTVNGINEKYVLSKGV